MKKLYIIFALFMPMLPPWQSTIRAAHRDVGIISVGTATFIAGIYQASKQELDNQDALTSVCFMFIGVCTILSADQIVKGYDTWSKR